MDATTILTPGATIDGAIAGIHVECARSRVDDGYAYRRRRDLFKRLGKDQWSKSNRLVNLLRSELAKGKHPADVWLDEVPMDLLMELMDEFLINPPDFEGIDLQTVKAEVMSGINPLVQFLRH